MVEELTDENILDGRGCGKGGYAWEVDVAEDVRSRHMGAVVRKVERCRLMDEAKDEAEISFFLHFLCVERL